MKVSSQTPQTIKQNAPKVDNRNDQAAKLIENDKWDQAITLLSQPGVEASSPETAKLLGTAYFMKGDFANAEAAYQNALKGNPDDAEVQNRLFLSTTNKLIDANYDVALNPIRPETINGTTRAGMHAAGPNWVEAPATSRLQKIGRGARTMGVKTLQLAKNVAGAALGGLFAVACRTFGEEDKQEVWTTWSRRNFAKAMMILGNMRDKLDHNNLHNPYPEGAKIGFADGKEVAPEGVQFARTADGSWNNLEDPLEGAARTRFSRNVDPTITKKPSLDEIMSPNPREISRTLFTRNEGFKEVPFLNLMAATWIQFMNHDWVSHGDNDLNQLYEVPLSKDDPLRKEHHMTHMLVPYTSADPTRRADEAGKPETYLNEVTHWWDGSQIYGSDIETQTKLRSGQDGKLKVDENGNIPAGKDGVEETGVKRNWWLGLSLMHNLFVKEHNSVCDMLKEKHPDWDDQRLFDVSRLIVAAEMAKIHTVEWTPAILPNKELNTAMHANWEGGAEFLTSKPGEQKALNHWEPNSQITGGIVGNATHKYDMPYALSEEFTAVYRLHSLLPEEVKLHKIGEKSGEETSVPLAQTRQRASHKITDGAGDLTNLMYSFGVEHPGQLVLNNYPKALQELSVPGFAAFDLGAIDIIRDRERGIPRYNEFRRQLHLNPITKFEDLTDDPKQVADLKRIYDNDVEKIDLLVGTLGEAHRPKNYGFGETMFAVFVLNASRRLQADRFFTESYNKETYTQEGLDRVDDCSMKGLLLRHFPGLAGTGLANVNNAFEPWDEGPKDASRHPLDAYR